MHMSTQVKQGKTCSDSSREMQIEIRIMYQCCNIYICFAFETHLLYEGNGNGSIGVFISSDAGSFTILLVSLLLSDVSSPNTTLSGSQNRFRSITSRTHPATCMGPASHSFDTKMFPITN